MSWIMRRIFALVEEHQPVLVVIEALAFAAKDTKLERAGLAYMVRYRLWGLGIRCVLVAPTSLKKFVTGSGNAEKNKVILRVFQNWQLEAGNDNEADAIALCQVARCLTGSSQVSNQKQQQVLDLLNKQKDEVL